MDGFNASLNAIVTQIQALQSKPSARPDVQSTMSILSTHQSTCPTALQTQVLDNHSASYSAAVKLSTVGVTAASGVSHSSAAKSAIKSINEQDTELKRFDWASQTSTPYLNRFGNRLYSDSDANHETDNHTETTDEHPFITVGSRKKRRRTRTNQGQSNASHVGLQTTSNTHAPHTERRSGPIIIGKLSAPADNNVRNIVAARPLLQKAVFCIDNVDQSVSVDDICSFVSGLSVNVLTCFETKPRRRRNNEFNDNHKAFRLCIAKDDRDRLLDASRWPAYISISDWYFKSSTQQTESKTGTSEGRPAGPAGRNIDRTDDEATTNITTAVNHNNHVNDTDMETTIITQVDNTNACLNRT